MILPVFYVHVAGYMDIGEYVAAETRTKAKAISIRNIRDAGFTYRYTDLRAIRALNGLDGITADLFRPRGLATYEVDARDRRNPQQVRVRIDPLCERAERRMAGVEA